MQNRQQAINPKQRIRCRDIPLKENRELLEKSVVEDNEVYEV